MALTVADQMIEVFVQAGVRRVYGLVGDSLNPLADAIRRNPAIEWVHVHNEEAAALAAAAEAQLTGQLAVCAGSCGPGNTHLVQGLYDAHRSGAPVLAIASHIPSTQIGTNYFQETHPQQLFLECSAYCELVSRPEQLPRLQRIAMQTAIAHRGVGVLVLPGDITGEPAAQPTGYSDLVIPSAVAHPDPAKVHALADRINAAATVTLFVGAGIRDAREEVLQLAGKVHSPIGHSLGGKEWIQYDNPYDVGMSGLLGYGACYEATHDFDLLILLGNLGRTRHPAPGLRPHPRRRFRSHHLRLPRRAQLRQPEIMPIWRRPDAGTVVAPSFGPKCPGRLKPRAPQLLILIERWANPQPFSARAEERTVLSPQPATNAGPVDPAAPERTHLMTAERSFVFVVPTPSCRPSGRSWTL
jgi:thiamine pyrophosphate-dependent acetolactate synthase large subunit-like protein